MSSETLDWLNRNVLIGFTTKRGNAWHYRGTEQGVESNHYPGAIPLLDVERRLFDWVPVEADLLAEYKDSGGHATVVKSEKHKAIVRPDTGAIVGVVGQNYTIHGYREWLLDNVHALIGEAGIGSAGLLEGGARAWVQVEVPENVETADGVKFRPFLAAATSLDGSMATHYITGAQVIVCDNTLKAALSEKDAKMLRIRHSTRSELRIDGARQALGILEATADAFIDQVHAQCQVKVSDAAWKRFLRAHFPLSNERKVASHPQLDRRAAVNTLYRSDPRVEPWAGTAYGVVAAVNTYEHHLAKGNPSRSRSERNAHRVLNGRFAQIDSSVYKTLIKVIQDEG